MRELANGEPAGRVHLIYDRDDRLLAETDASGVTLKEYVWLGDLPVAVLDGTRDPQDSTLLFVQADHLERPLRLTDASGQGVWRASYDPFGAVTEIAGSASLDLRFPGQWFQLETGLHYNWHRHYDPTTGRYTTPDPLGFVDGPSVYGYARQSPLSQTDPMGLETVVILGGATRGNPFGHVAIGFTGQGVYSYGTGTPRGSSLTDYLAQQSTYRSSTVYTLNTTSEQEARMLAKILAFEDKDLPNPLKDPLGALRDTCAVRTQSALEAGGISSSLIPFLSPFPADTALIAIMNGARSTAVPQGGPVPFDLSAFNR